VVGLGDGVDGMKMMLPVEALVGLEQCCCFLSESWSCGVVWEALTGPWWVLRDGRWPGLAGICIEWPDKFE
jgi:hypothetical protein